MTDVREVTRTGKQHWHKEPRLKTASMSEEGEDNRQRHQRRQELRLGGQKILYEIFGQTLDLEVVKRAVGNMIVRTLWRCRPPPKRKEQL